MQVLNGVKNFLTLVNDNWTLIIVVIGLGLYTYKRVVDYLSKSDEEKIEMAWSAISDCILAWVSEAEQYWTVHKGLDSAGAIKRSEVIAKIFEQYPILNKITNQQEVLDKIDDLIEQALIEMREILKLGDDDNEPTKAISEK